MHEALARAKFVRDAAALSDAAALRIGLQVNERAFPVLDATILHTRPLRLRFQADNWDELPPSIAMLNVDGSYLTEKLPGQIFNGGPHPNTSRPFICMRGSREYHTYSSHVNDKWDNYRGTDGMRLFGIMMQLSTAWRKVA